MSLSKQVYEITDWFGHVHSLTAKQLCNQILEDSKSNYNWIAPARELVRICKESNFPAIYAIPIKVAILNCFANIEHAANCGGDRYAHDYRDQKAVEYCYNSMYCNDVEEVVEVRKYYLAEMIATTSEIRGIHHPLYHPGPTFRKLREDWRKSKFEEYFSLENIDFELLVRLLRIDFYDTVKKAESDGAFKKDEEDYAKQQEALYKNVFLL